MNIRSFIGGALCRHRHCRPQCLRPRTSPLKQLRQASNRPSPTYRASQFAPLVVDYPPAGASLPHEHAKSAFIFAYVLSGEIESQVNNEPKRVYRAGESFYETPGSTHLVSRNASKTEPAKLLAVFIVDTDDKELTTTISTKE